MASPLLYSITGGELEKTETLGNKGHPSKRISADVCKKRFRCFQLMIAYEIGYTTDVNQIKQKVSDLNIQNAETQCFDFEKECLSDLHADYIFMVQVLLHISDVELVLSRLYDVLNEGGHLLTVDFNKNEQIVSDIVHNGFDQIELASIMTKIGYKNIQSKTFYAGSKIFMGQDASMFILDSTIN